VQGSEAHVGVADTGVREEAVHTSAAQVAELPATFAAQHSAGVQAVPAQSEGLVIAVVPAAHTSAPLAPVAQGGPVFATQVSTVKGDPVTHAAAALLAVNPTAHSIVQLAAAAILSMPAPHGATPPVPAPFSTTTTGQPGEESALQVNPAKVVPVHKAVAPLGVYPPWHAVAQFAASAILVVPAPHGAAPPAPAPLRTAATAQPAAGEGAGPAAALAAQHSAGVQAVPEQSEGLVIAVVPAAHISAPLAPVAQAGPAFAAQVTPTKADPETHADVNALAVNPAWHAIVQACPSAILLIPGPHGSAPLVPAPLATVVTAQPGGVLTSQVTGFKVVVPVGQLAVVALGVYPP